MAKVSLGVNFVSLLRLNFLSYYTCYLISLDFITHETAPLHCFPAKNTQTITMKEEVFAEMG